MPAPFRPRSLLLLLILGCSSGSGTAASPQPNPEPSDVARVRIENRASLDMDIYVIRSDRQRVRLGFVGGGDTEVFALPATITAGATSFTFEARPVRRSGQSVVSELLRVSAGEEFVWSVPPQ
jgi:hypothetical protein